MTVSGRIVLIRIRRTKVALEGIGSFQTARCHHAILLTRPALKPGSRALVERVALFQREHNEDLGSRPAQFPAANGDDVRIEVACLS